MVRRRSPISSSQPLTVLSLLKKKINFERPSEGQTEFSHHQRTFACKTLSPLKKFQLVCLIKVVMTTLK